MKMTIWGCASRIGGLAVERNIYDEVIGGHSYDEIALELPEHGVTVDLDHQAGTELGELIYGEVATDGRVNVVCVLDDDRIDRIDEDIYFSPELAMSGERIRARSRSYVADSATMLGLALTMDPLTSGAVPIKRRSGDVRSSADRRSWSVAWRSRDPLLARAADYAGADLRTRARRLVDLRERDDDSPWRYREGEWIPLAERRPAGALRYRTGKILRVPLLV
jgi:hypothetical protein